MPLSWNEIRHRAIGFSKSWAGESSEKSEKQTFWNEFFQVFGHDRRLVATFEAPVQSIKGTYGFIDLFWPRNLIVEHKSLGGDLSSAQSQAFRYLPKMGGFWHPLAVLRAELQIAFEAKTFNSEKGLFAADDSTK